MTIEILLEAKTLLDKGKSLKTIAKELNVKYRTLLANLKSHGFYTPTRKPAVEITAELTKQIVVKFNQGLTFREIGKSLNISENTVGNKLKDLGLYTARDYGWTEKQKVELQNLYNKGHSSRELAKLYNCSKARILDALEETREPSSYRKYNLNHYAFNSIITQEQAYWLGFLYADGSVGSTENSIALGLTDRESVEDFRDFLQTDRPIYLDKRSEKNPKWKDSYNLKVHSEILKNDLIKLGCVPKKTKGLCELPNISKNLIRHFIRGYFDGDGSVWSSKNRTHFSITGSFAFIENIQRVLIEELKLTKTKITKRKEKYGDIRYGGKANLQKLYNYMYKDSIVYMSRKKTTFEQLLNN